MLTKGKIFLTEGDNRFYQLVFKYTTRIRQKSRSFVFAYCIMWSPKSKNDEHQRTFKMSGVIPRIRISHLSKRQIPANTVEKFWSHHLLTLIYRHRHSEYAKAFKIVLQVCFHQQNVQLEIKPWLAWWWGM